jgi:hypothetical protein
MPRAVSSVAGRPRHHGPPVRSLPLYARAYQGRHRTTASGRWSPRHDASDQPSIKAGASPRECRAAQCNCQSAAGPSWPPPRDPLPMPSSTVAQPLHTSASPTEASRAAHSFAPAATPPEHGATRLTPVAAGVRPHRHTHRSKLRPKSSQGTPLVALRPRPAGPGRRLTGIWPDRRRPVLGDYIASPQFFSGSKP